MAQLLLIIGSSIFGILGSLHLYYTHWTNKLDPRDASTIEAMRVSNMILTKETTVWDAWIGFNSSHSLGAMLFAGIYIPLSIWHFELIAQSLWFSLLPLLVGVSYAVLAKRYWFSIPLGGILISTLCFMVAAILIIV